MLCIARKDILARIRAKAMTEAGADIIVAHVGVTTGGSIGATPARTLDQCRPRFRRTRPMSSSAPPGIDGFYGPSSAERRPAERAVAEQIRALKAL